MLSPVSAPGSEMILYKTEDGQLQVDVRLQDETVWLSQMQIAELFQKDVRTVNEHMRNIFKEGEVASEGTIRKFRMVRKEGKRTVEREIEHYNLDMILSVGYRVNSKRGTQFRIWATTVLRQHLLQGFSIHQRRLQEKGFKELQQAIALVRQTSSSRALTEGEAKGLLHVITDYTQTWLLLHQYDEGKVKIPATLHPPRYRLTEEDAWSAIRELRRTLRLAREASELFGVERGGELGGIIGNLYQTFDRKELYPTLEEKAAHILYFVIKDHPFTDGNKRIAVLLFLLFLYRNGSLQVGFGNNLQDTMLVALALLIAESHPKQKDVMLAMILHFIAAPEGSNV